MKHPDFQEIPAFNPQLTMYTAEVRDRRTFIADDLRKSGVVKIYGVRPCVEHAYYVPMHGEPQLILKYLDTGETVKMKELRSPVYYDHDDALLEARSLTNTSAAWCLDRVGKSLSAKEMHDAVIENSCDPPEKPEDKENKEN